MKCGLVPIHPTQFMEFQVGKFKYVHSKHCPREYLEGKMRQMGGDHDGLLDRIDKEELKARALRCITWADVYSVCADMDVKLAFLSVPSLFGWRGIDLETMRIVLDVIYKQKFKSQVMYIIYKISQIRGTPDPWVPLKISYQTLKKAEVEWVDIALYLGVPCKKTLYQDLLTPWTIEARSRNRYRSSSSRNCRRRSRASRRGQPRRDRTGRSYPQRGRSNARRA